ncbi:MAG: hypothetical protein HYX92_16160 [Chloroflexi bacterium]|nr:hypothetical protein [Chloroflexota bacterium]
MRRRVDSVAIAMAAALLLTLASVSPAAQQTEWPPVKVDLAIEQQGTVFRAEVWVRNEGNFDTDVMSIRGRVPEGARFVDSWAGPTSGANAGAFDGNDVGWVNIGTKAGERRGPFVFVFDAGALDPASPPFVQAWVSWTGEVPGTAVSRRAEIGIPLTVAALRRGGHVVLIPHAETDRSIAPPEQRVPDASPLDLRNCEVQARLTERGRADARAIGASFRTLGIPVGQVLVDAYCRTFDTARLAFGDAQLSDILLPPEYVPVPGAPVPPGFPQRIEALKQLLATPPPAGTNIVLVTHRPNIRAVGFEVPQREVDAFIFRPDEQQGFTLLARVLLHEWTAFP